MKVVFFSNFLNNHIIDFCDELYLMLKKDFVFYQRTLHVEQIEERIKNGIHDLLSTRLYAHKLDYKSDIKSIIKSNDIVIVGSENKDVCNSCIKYKKTLFKLAERPFKNDEKPIIYFFKKIKYSLSYASNKNAYLLSLSSFNKTDYKNTLAYKDRIFKFGYFPHLYLKKQNKNFFEKSFLWVGRLIDWKHPEIAIRLISDLNKLGIESTLKIIGDGPEKDYLIREANQKNISEKILFLGAQEEDSIREIMYSSNFYLFTSDKKEGWGAVLNEAMNSGCICFASSSAGSTNYLIQDNYNGYTFSCYDELLDKVLKCLSRNEKYIRKISNNAQATIIEEWNGKNAARKFIIFCESILHNKRITAFESGVLSKES